MAAMCILLGQAAAREAPPLVRQQRVWCAFARAEPYGDRRSIHWSAPMLAVMREGRRQDPPVPWEVLADRIGVDAEVLRRRARAEGIPMQGTWR